MKLGIIRCMQTQDYCPGTGDFKAVAEKTGAFADIEEPIILRDILTAEAVPAKKPCSEQGKWQSAERIPSPLPAVSAREARSAIPVLLPIR